MAAALRAPPREWVTIAVVEAAVVLILSILALSFRRRVGKSHTLTIETRDSGAVDEIWMNNATMKELNLKWGDTIRIQGVGRNAYRNPRHARLRARRSLPNNHIGLGPDLQVLLFKDLPEGGPLRGFAFAPGVHKGGLEEFWFNPNEQIRFQNRMGVMLGLGLPAFQMLWSWIGPNA
jgi:hypothetical protein